MPDIFSNTAFMWILFVFGSVVLLALISIGLRLKKISSFLSDENSISEPAPKAASVPSVVSSNSGGIPAEVVAAIAGAVAMIEGEGAVLQSITPANRAVSAQRRSNGPGEWGFSARAELTQPF